MTNRSLILKGVYNQRYDRPRRMSDFLPQRLLRASTTGVAGSSATSATSDAMPSDADVAAVTRELIGELSKAHWKRHLASLLRNSYFELPSSVELFHRNATVVFGIMVCASDLLAMAPWALDHLSGIHGEPYGPLVWRTVLAVKQGLPSGVFNRVQLDWNVGTWSAQEQACYRPMNIRLLSTLEAAPKELFGLFVTHWRPLSFVESFSILLNACHDMAPHVARCRDETVHADFQALKGLVARWARARKRDRAEGERAHELRMDIQRRLLLLATDPAPAEPHTPENERGGGCEDDDADVECSICYMGLAKNAHARTVTPCKHTFCASCMQMWKENCWSSRIKLSCPMCRAEL